MIDTEGVTKFELEFSAADPPAISAIAEAGSWRDIFFRLGVIGQREERYLGYAFGNVSCRATDNRAGEKQPLFYVTGSQTGRFEVLGARHFSIVSGYDLSTNYLRASGAIEPSSESLSHAALYDADPDISFVFHVHSPEIWRNAGRLDIPETAPEILYGTPEMAEAIKLAYNACEHRSAGLISMAGHEDGIISYGYTAQAAGICIVVALAQSMALERSA